MKKINFKLKKTPSFLENAAFQIIKKLSDGGYETYIAGGAVRDFYLNRVVSDIDIATSARPEEIKKIFPKSFDRGKAFGVVALAYEDFEFEVATFRSDIGIEDHRRPKKVEFTTSENDALRRDFTINALFFDPLKSEIIDYVDGIRDLESRIIRFVGDPGERINEDYLRMLRAIRFQNRLGFVMENRTQEAIKKNASLITKISIERIREELNMILTDPKRKEALGVMESLGLLEILLPEIAKLHKVDQPPEFHSEGDVWTHTMMAMESLVDPSAELAWTVLLHDIGKPETQGFRDHPKSKITFFNHDVLSATKAGEILNRMRFSNAFIEACVWAISEHMRIVNAFRGMSERKQEKLFTNPHIDLLLDLTKADLGASLKPDKTVDLSMYKDALRKKQEFESKKTPEKEQIKKFTLISGKDIMEILNIPPSKKVGTVKQKIEDCFLEGKISTRKEAIEMIEALK